MRSMGRVGVRRTSRARSLLFMDSFSFACASSHIPFETGRMLKFEGKKTTEVSVLYCQGNLVKKCIKLLHQAHER